MPVRNLVSALEASIIPQIKSYIRSRTIENQSKKNLTPDDGIEVMTDAIALGINEAFKSPAMNALFSAIIDTNATAVIPIGTIAYNSTMSPATVASVPNPLLG